MYHPESELSSEPFIEYLLNKNWTLMESEPDIAVLRKVYAQEEEEIVLPRDRSYGDYQQRIREAIQFLAKHEHISEKNIIDELLLQKWDILRIKIKGDQIGSGCISFLDKAIIEEGVRKILLASARSVSNPKPYFKRLYSSSVEQWMKKCRSGTFEAGSFILTLRLPLERDLEEQEIPFSRKVAEYLMSSLSLLADFGENPSSFLDTTDPRLNANFCLGVAEMKPDEAPIYFDFEMKWSSEVPIDRKIPVKVEIQDRYFSTILHIGQRLKPQTEITQNEFVGKVLALHGLPGECGTMQGEATLILLLDDQQTKAKVFLDPALYAQACDAHKHNKYIRTSGVLLEKPRCSDLRDVTLFEVLE